MNYEEKYKKYKNKYLNKINNYKLFINLKDDNLKGGYNSNSYITIISIIFIILSLLYIYLNNKKSIKPDISKIDDSGDSIHNFAPLTDD